MEPQGYRTFLASCGEEALDIVQDEEVHLALLDVHMPTMTGLEVLRLLRQMRELPVILVTADATPSLIRQAPQARGYLRPQEGYRLYDRRGELSARLLEDVRNNREWLLQSMR